MGVIDKLLRALSDWPWARRRVSKIAINRIIGTAPRRPHPFSQLSDYTSWDSLIDRSYNGRHLPADPAFTRKLPPIENVLHLFRYREPNKWIPSKRSTLLFSNFALWFTDGFLRTNRKPDVTGGARLQNESNHEVDLSPLYGLNKAQTDVLRSNKDGKLKSQMLNGEEYPLFLMGGSFTAEEIKILNMQLTDSQHHPETIFAMGGERSNVQIGYVMFNVLFLREHNRICNVLKEKYNFDDEQLFQTARIINIAQLLKLVVEEYINHISASSFKLISDPLSFADEPWHRQNWMTVEFNLLYRWHSLTPPELKYAGQTIPTLTTIEHNDLIIDRGLGIVMDEASRQPAGEIGLHNTWGFLVDHAEKAALKQARDANLASYNAYRKAFSLKPCETFEDLTSDVALRQELKCLYGHIDNVEYLVGIFAEEKRGKSILPELMTRMVSVEAFSQALNNPLFAPRVFNDRTFTPHGMEIIKTTKSLSDILHRNVPNGQFAVSLTALDQLD
jgi:prostaglandin-endoperoxide synthase 2